MSGLDTMNGLGNGRNGNHGSATPVSGSVSGSGVSQASGVSGSGIKCGGDGEEVKANEEEEGHHAAVDKFASVPVQCVLLAGCGVVGGGGGGGGLSSGFVGGGGLGGGGGGAAFTSIRQVLTRTPYRGGRAGCAVYHSVYVVTRYTPVGHTYTEKVSEMSLPLEEGHPGQGAPLMVCSAVHLKRPWLAIGHMSGCVVVLDVDNCASPIVQVLADHCGSPVTSLSFSPSVRYVLATHADDYAAVFDTVALWRKSFVLQVCYCTLRLAFC